MNKNIRKQCDDELIILITNTESLYQMRFELGEIELREMGFKFTDTQLRNWLEFISEGE